MAPLLLLSEQSVLRNVYHGEAETTLTPLRTPDGRLLFRSSIVYSSVDTLFSSGTASKKIRGSFGSSSSSGGVKPSSHSTIHLSFDAIKATCPFMISCLMTGVCSFRGIPRLNDSTEPPPPLLKDEAVVCVNSNNIQVRNVVSMRYANTHPFDVINIIYRVYEPHGGTSPRLNQARLDGATLCDMTLVAVDGQELPAHRAVLGVRSPVMHKMMTSDFKEAREGRVQLEFPKDVLEKFLEFIYMDQVQDWGSSELELMELAEKYMVPELRSACLNRLSACDGPRALELLYADAANADGRLSHIIGSPLRRRLTKIVADNFNTLRYSKQWTDFQAASPYAVDMIIGCLDSAVQIVMGTTTTTNLLLM